MEKMKENRSGSYIPVKFADEIEEHLHSRNDVSFDFVCGACAALAFLSTPEDSTVYGCDPKSFFDSVVLCCKDLTQPPEEIVDIAQAVIDRLKSMGVEVIEVGFERVDD